MDKVIKSVLVSTSLAFSLPLFAEKPSFEEYVSGIKKEGIEKYCLCCGKVITTKRMKRLTLHSRFVFNTKH